MHPSFHSRGGGGMTTRLTSSRSGSMSNASKKKNSSKKKVLSTILVLLQHVLLEQVDMVVGVGLRGQQVEGGGGQLLLLWPERWRPREPRSRTSCRSPRGIPVAALLAKGWHHINLHSQSLSSGLLLQLLAVAAIYFYSTLWWISWHISLCLESFGIRSKTTASEWWQVQGERQSTINNGTPKLRIVGWWFLVLKVCLLCSWPPVCFCSAF